MSHYIFVKEDFRSYKQNTGHKSLFLLCSADGNMRTKYCCDVTAHENYYLNQIGHGTPYFSGAAYQKGYGLGGIFSSIAKSVVPLIKSGAKAVGKQVLQSGVCV